MSEDNRKFDKYVGEINDLLVSYVNKETAYDVCSVYLIDDYNAYLSIIEKVKEIESKYSFARKISFGELWACLVSLRLNIYFTTSTHCPLVRAINSLSYMASHCKPGK